MKTLLEKAIVHLLNGDDEKASALFHKFMVERARQIHESLRQDGSDELDENWDSEIKEEEYFGDDDLGDEGDPAMDSAPVDGDGPPMDGAETDEMGGEDLDADVASDVDADVDADLGDDDMGNEMDDTSMDGEPGVEDKIDDLTDKIDQLTAEFDRVMAEFHDDSDDDMGDMGDDTMGEPDGDDFGSEAPVDDFGGDEPTDDAGSENGDLANRMEDDMADEEVPDHEPVAESEDMGDEGEDDDLTDITESVLAELDKITLPANSQGAVVGSGSAPSQKIVANNESPLPHHNVMDRIKGEPVMTKGPTHDGYAREASPPVKGPAGLGKAEVRKGNRRNSFKDTMAVVPPKGDASAELNKDFAGGPKPTKSIVDGKTKKG